MAPEGTMNRREFLARATAAGAATGLQLTWARRAAAASVEELKQAFAARDLRVLLETGFEEGQPLPEMPHHQLVTGAAHGGRRCVVGEVGEPNRARFLEIPFDSRKGRMLHLSFWIRGERGTGCAVWARAGKRRTRIGGLRPLGNRWRHVMCSYRVAAPAKGVLQIVAPTSYGESRPGRAWIDDVTVLETPWEDDWPACVQDFPALTCDAGGTFWLASLERPKVGPSVRVDRLEGTERRCVCTLAPKGRTGLAAPAVAPRRAGCVVAFPVEQDDRWRVAVAFVDAAPGRRAAGATPPELRYLDAGGSSNINPAVAVVGDRACVLWESNAGDARGIYAAWVARDGATEPRRLSSAEHNSYNPAVVARADGSLFAAWDSLRAASADLYAAEHRGGRWRAERRLTRGARIERHPSLAAWRDQLWMAWQAQSYPKMKLNFLSEQRVVVARIDGGTLRAPLGLFERVSPPRSFLMRPRIAFDAQGRLWLSARRSIGQQEGWQPLAWCYSGRRWNGPRMLMYEQGRWRPAAMAFAPAGAPGAEQGAGLAACQYDDLPRTWEQRGVHPDWPSGLKLRPLGGADAPAPAPPATEPLEMPPTEFSLAAKLDLVAADLPRQRVRHGGGELTLFWGDLHDHTDLSVCQRRGNPPGHDLLANLRDIDRLDFCAMTDHGYNFDPPQWAFNGEQTRANHDPGRFVVFLGEEWTSSANPPAGGGRPRPEAPRRYGHHNVVFLDPHHGRFYDAFDGDISPGDLWKRLEGVEFLCIPHQLADWKGKGSGNPPTDWSFHDERLQPVAEIFQARQSYEHLGCPRQAPQGAPFRRFYLQDAWARGIVIGVIASPDHGGGNAKVGVWAPELTRRAIFDAIRARHTFGTSGAKMALLVRCGEAIMGDKLPRPRGALRFAVRAVAKRDIRELVIFRNNQVVHRAAPGRKQFELTWTDEQPPADKLLWYYARIHAADDELAWSSPIWFTA